MKTFAEALGLIGQQRTEAQPIECPGLLALAGPAYQDTPNEPAPMNEFEAAALCRLAIVIADYSPELWRALQAVPLPLEVRADEGQLYLGYDTLGNSSRQYVQVQLGVASGTDMKLPGGGPHLGYYIEGSPEALASDEECAKYDRQALAELSGWVPYVRTNGYPRMQPVGSPCGAEFLARIFAQMLAGPKATPAEATAAQLGGQLSRAMPTRLYLASQAPAMPEGWQPDGIPAPAHPVKNYQHYDIDLDKRVAAYEAALATYATEYSAYVVRQATQWPLAWADAILLLHTAQQ